MNVNYFYRIVYYTMRRIKEFIYLYTLFIYFRNMWVFILLLTVLGGDCQENTETTRSPWYNNNNNDNILMKDA